MSEKIYTQSTLKENAFKEKTIVVTGGGAGLGKATSKYFSELGANVIISGATGNEVLPVQCDVSDYAQVENMLKTAVEKFGKVDPLVNNAAGNFISHTERLSHRAFDIIVNIVLKGTYNCTLAFDKNWIEKKQPATVVNIITTYA